MMLPPCMHLCSGSLGRMRASGRSAVLDKGTVGGIVRLCANRGQAESPRGWQLYRHHSFCQTHRCTQRPCLPGPLHQPPAACHLRHSLWCQPYHLQLKALPCRSFAIFSACGCRHRCCLHVHKPERYANRPSQKQVCLDIQSRQIVFALPASAWARIRRNAYSLAASACTACTCCQNPLCSVMESSEQSHPNKKT